MDIQINVNQIIDKLQNRIGQDAKTIAALESMIDIYKEKLSEFENEDGTKVKER